MIDLRARLLAKKMKPIDLAKASGYSKRYINYLLSRDKRPEPDAAKKIAKCSKHAFRWTDFYPDEERDIA
jgi:transcriptional regulator with XRE-family HTH domain